MNKATHIIHFEDNGQDFLEWHIDNVSGLVVDCKPFQASIWNDSLLLIDVTELEVGSTVPFVDKRSGKLCQINHKIKSVEDCNIKDISVRDWEQIKGH